MKNEIKNQTNPSRLEANNRMKAGLEDVNHSRTAAREHPKVACSRCQPIVAALLLAGSLAAPGNNNWAASLDSDAASSESVAVPSEHADTRSCAVENSVVKIFATVRFPDLAKPWTKQPPTEVTGSGVVIEGKRILSNSHVVGYATQVEVQGTQSGEKFAATVEAVDSGIDLAVLKLEDESFFQTHRPLPRAQVLPRIRDAVMAYGFPQGGSGLSITKGIVSRIEFALYNAPACGLRIQIDAAINPGNSGGPVVAGDKMIGLAFSHLSTAQNVGYVIPCEEIDLFLRNIADGHCARKPAMLGDLQTLENPALRSFLKLDRSVEGIVVNRPLSNDPSYLLKRWDVVTKIGNVPVDNLGMVTVAPDLRLNLAYIFQKLARSGDVALTLVRDGKIIRVDFPASAYPQQQVIAGLNGGYPSYFVCGPLVFSTVSTEMVGELAEGAPGGFRLTILAAVGSPMVRRLGEPSAFPGENLVVVSSPFLPHRLTKGYDNPVLQVVKRVNGIGIKNLQHLVEVVRDSKDEFLVFEFDSRSSETMVFPRQEMLAATDGILSENGIRSQGSPDLLTVWNARVRSSTAVASAGQ